VSTNRTAVRVDMAEKGTYSELLREVRLAGLFEPQTRYYVVKIAINAAGMLGAWVLFSILGDSWLQLVTATFLAFMFGQYAIVAHDTGHCQISRSRQINAALGYLHMDLAIGLSFGWWVERHRRHHTYPNDVDRDPDIINEFVAFTSVQLDRRGTWRRWISRYQAFLFFPVMFLAQGFAMHFSHVRGLLRLGRRGRAVELCLLTAHAVLYTAAVILVLSPVRALVFVIVHQGLYGTYLGGIIAPNHKGMEILEDSRGSDFLIRQLHASRNIRGGRLVETFFGGLNHQIEHHLFPSMPVPCLRRARPIVRAFCQRHGLRYVETDLFESYQQAFASLHAVGRVPSTPTVVRDLHGRLACRR
jgi:fatty acid desaturase